MDFTLAKSVFKSLYADINGYNVSTQARKKLPYTDKAHTYGEVTPEGFHQILKEVGQSEGVFYDLGSGTGKAVILASLFGDFSKLVGIEIIEDLYKTAKGVLDRFDKTVRPIFPPDKNKFTVDFIHANFFDVDISDANLIFTHSTCFYDEIMNQLERKFVSLRKGTKIITVTKSLVSPFFRLLKSNEFPMTWGKATVNIYEKV